MSVAIRLARGGAKKRPYYRIVVADKRMKRDGRFIERVGSYNPMLAKQDAARVVLNEERIRHWLECGAQPSERVRSFLAAAKMMPPRAVPKQTVRHISRAKRKGEGETAAAPDATAAS